MNYSYDADYDNEYGYADGFAADVALDRRLAFIRRTYVHVFGAVLALIGIEAVLFSMEAAVLPLARLMIGNWWAVLLLYMAAGWVAERWANSDTSVGMQYLGLALFTAVEAMILFPLLYIAQKFGSENIIPTAGFLTLLIFGGLTMIVMLTKKDFSFMRNILCVCSFAALGLIVASMIIGFSLGLIFVVAMIALVSGYILYYTSNVLHHYHTDQHVAASLALFSSITTLFWYVLQLLMILGSDD
ncbi:MAG: Bax inhibitor-1 family protein [Planctomycetaceae bacterium]